MKLPDCEAHVLLPRVPAPILQECTWLHLEDPYTRRCTGSALYILHQCRIGRTFHGAALRKFFEFARAVCVIACAGIDGWRKLGTFLVGWRKRKFWVFERE